jgi:chorismate synthase
MSLTSVRWPAWTDTRPSDYASISAAPRPSHADFTYQVKYGIRAASGGGRSSARETAGAVPFECAGVERAACRLTVWRKARVAAGAAVEKWLRLRFGVDIVAWVASVGSLSMSEVSHLSLSVSLSLCLSVSSSRPSSASSFLSRCALPTVLHRRVSMQQAALLHGRNWIDTSCAALRRTWQIRCKQ